MRYSLLFFIFFSIIIVGYREAQCGWLVVSDPSESQSRAQCLCIYLPRRGILEVCMISNIATFSIIMNL